LSLVNGPGFNIPGRDGDTNPLTGDKITKIDYWALHSKSILSEIEVWEIVYID
jgi:hypothetical protein